MNPDGELLEASTEDLFENAPCGYLSTALDGTLLKVNRTFLEWTGLEREQLVGKRRFQDLLSRPGRIYHETHVSPLLQMQGLVREIALDIVHADGSHLPALVNSVVVRDGRENPQLIRTTVFDATDRRRYEDELLRARRREHEVAQKLQRSMLAGSLPSGRGLEVGASYRPAVRGLEIGGDWYDAFWLDESKVGLVVGDVVGRGIEAAAVMGQLRSATRALASTGLHPAALIEALDAYSSRHEVGAVTTLVYAELDLGKTELRFACAGHPPPLVACRGQEPQLMWEGRSPPLGVPPAANGREEGACTLAPGGLVALYTDGLIERRGRSIDAGLEELIERIRAHREQPPDKLVANVVRAQEEADAHDDVCLLAASLDP